MQAEYSTQVLVVGAGASGIPAAIAAARAGAQVLLVEEDPVIGGAMSDYYVDMLCGGPVTGVVKEARAILEASHRIVPQAKFFLPSSFQRVYGDLLRAEANIRVLTGARANGVLRTKRDGVECIGGITIEGAPGVSVPIIAEVVIDATGTGIIAMMAGAQARYGREAKDEFGESLAVETPDDQVQNCTWMYISQQKPGAPHFDMMRLENVRYGVMVDGLGWYRNDPDEARRLDPGVYLHWGCSVLCRDTRDPLALAEAQQEAFQAMERDHALLLENGYTVHLAPRLGVREASRIVGDHIITEGDLRSGVLPEDTIALGWYGLDIWGHSSGSATVDAVKGYGIPYRALLPQGVEGMLVTGKSLSGTHVAMSAYRVMPIVGPIGQAAGLAAALCVQRQQRPRQVDVRDVRAILCSERQGVQLEFDPE